MITYQRLKELFHYDHATGVLFRLNKQGEINLTSKVGTIGKSGYVCVCADYKLYKAHRLAWLYFYGEWPKDMIDHINGIRSDNRIENLRNSNRVHNGQNQRKAHVNNKTGFLGVSKNPFKDGYIAAIKTNNKYVSLGSYETPELAHEIYLAAKRKLHEGCTI